MRTWQQVQRVIDSGQYKNVQLGDSVEPHIVDTESDSATFLGHEQGCIHDFFWGGGTQGVGGVGGMLPQEIFGFRLSETASGAFSGTL